MSPLEFYVIFAKPVRRIINSTLLIGLSNSYRVNKDLIDDALLATYALTLIIAVWVETS